MLMFTAAVGLNATAAVEVKGNTLTLNDIYVRDPYIYADESTHTYYLYRSSHENQPNGTFRGGVEVFQSKDLKNWTGPKRVLTIPKDNWITGAVWAPEMHEYNGKYYLFATINSDVVWRQDAARPWLKYTWRGTQIFRAESPEGPFEAFDDKMPITPYSQMCLDGTLYEENGQPYLVYCHEWVEITDGTMNAVSLSKDLSHRIGEPVTLFCSSAASWSTGLDQPDGSKSYITDGCYLYKSEKSGKLFMIWSSFDNGQYALGVAESATGRVLGPWIQQPEPIFSHNGGHGMIFRSFNGDLYLILHSPNEPDQAERAHLFKLIDTGNTLTLANE